jgi:hypothetical protein
MGGSTSSKLPLCYGTFAGSLVVQQKVSSFWGAFFNASGLLIPVVVTVAFQLRVPHEIY